MTCAILRVSLKKGIHFHHQIAASVEEESVVHTGREGERIFFFFFLDGGGVSWPCKTCMVISVKSSKILTCIDLHHAASLDGGLDGCSSRLKAQYSRPSSPIFWKGTRGKKKILFQRRLLGLLSENSLWKGDGVQVIGFLIAWQRC